MSKIEIEFPEGLCKEAVSFMEIFLKDLENVESVTVCDTAAVWMLMMTFDSYIKASKDVLARGHFIYDKHNRSKLNPSVNLVNKYYFHLLGLMKEYGFTLKSKEHIKALSSDVDDDNPLFQFLKNSSLK